MNKFICNSILILFFCSCGIDGTISNKEIFEDTISEVDSVIQIKNSVETKSNLTFDSVIKQIDYIFLKSNDDLFISSINDVKHYDNKLFILDGKAHKLFICNMMGEILYVINSRGKANNEYTRLTSFDIDRDKSLLYLLDADIGKVLVYNFQAEQTDIIKLPFKWANHIKYKGNNKFIFELGHRGASPKNGLSPYVVVFDYNKNEIAAEYLKFKCDEISFLMRNDVAFSNYEDMCYYWSPLGTTIFEINDYTIKKNILIDFGNNTMPNSICRQTPRKAIELIREKKYSICDRFYCSDNWYFLRITNGATIKHYLYDKWDINNVLILSPASTLNFPKAMTPELYQISDNKLCGYIDAINFTRIVECENNGVQEGDNPILLIYTLK